MNDARRPAERSILRLNTRTPVVSFLSIAVLSACGSSTNPPSGSGGAGGVSSMSGGGHTRGGASTTGGTVSAAGNRASGGNTSGGASTTGGTAGGGAAASSTTGGTVTTGGSASTPTGGAMPTTGGSATTTGGTETAGGAAGSAGAAPVVDTSPEIFDPTRLPRFDIELPAASLTTLNAITGSEDPKQNEYVRATLRYGDETVLDVGLRIKGEGSFRKLDKKTAFKIKFDEFVPKQSFHGLRRLTLNNMVEDPSFLAERLAYDLYRIAGLPAPRCNSALVYVNDAFYGVYANVEAEDKTFLARWFPSNDGNLYEEGQKDFVPGAETAFDLETNETANERSGLKALIAAVQSAQPDTFLADLSASLDTAHFLRFTAAEAAVNQWDMYSYTVFYPNNFRLYENPADSKFVFLPWGMDMSMKPYRDSGRPHIPVFGIARMYDKAANKITAGIMFQKCLESASCKAAYIEQVRDIADVYEHAELATSAARYYAQIKESVYADPRKEYTNERFEQGYQTLLKTIAERPAALRADL